MLHISRRIIFFFILLTFHACTFAQDDLIAKFSFEGTLKNSTKNKNEIKRIIGNISYIEGVSGKGISLDGNSYIIGNGEKLPQGKQDRTICLFAKSKDNKDGEEPNFAFSWGMDKGQSGYGILEDGAPWVISHNWFTYTHCDGVNKPCDIDFGVSTNKEWQFICSVYNGDEIINFMNGVEVSRKRENIDTNGTTFYIGSGPMEYFFFNGLLDEISIFNRSLSSEEINKLMH